MELDINIEISERLSESLNLLSASFLASNYSGVEAKEYADYIKNVREANEDEDAPPNKEDSPQDSEPLETVFEQKAVTSDQVKAAMAEKVAAGKSDGIRTIIAKYGIEKKNKFSPEKLLEIYSEVIKL
jgi:hypothetical protein